VGLLGARQRHGLAPVCGLADHGEVVGAVQQRTEPGADELLVVCDGDPDHRGFLVGTDAATSKPPPVLPARSVPPISSARSRMPARPCPPPSTRPPRPSSTTRISSRSGP